MNDQSVMTFGKFAGKKLEDIPASYFRWIYNNAARDTANDRMQDILDYIDENVTALMAEDPDGIWEKA